MTNWWMVVVAGVSAVASTLTYYFLRRFLPARRQVEASASDTQTYRTPAVDVGIHLDRSSNWTPDGLCHMGPELCGEPDAHQAHPPSDVMVRRLSERLRKLPLPRPRTKTRVG